MQGLTLSAKVQFQSFLSGLSCLEQEPDAHKQSCFPANHSETEGGDVSSLIKKLFPGKVPPRHLLPPHSFSNTTPWFTVKVLEREHVSISVNRTVSEYNVYFLALNFINRNSERC